MLQACSGKGRVAEEKNMERENTRQGIQVKNLHKSFQTGSERTQVLRGVDFTLAPGEFCAVMGRSGCGKSTLMNILCGLERADDGMVFVDGLRIDTLDARALARYRREKIGIVFQGFYLDETRNLIDNVSMPCGYAGVPAKERNKRAEALLKKFGLFSERKKRPSQISGGQQQRAAIARALVNHPRYLFADEPTGNLDEENTRRVMELFQKLNQKGIGILMVTHDTAVAECAQRIVKMEQGILVSQSV